MTKKTTNLEKKKIDWREIDVSELERMQQPGYRRINQGLASNATPVEKAKYKLCKSILGYKQDNDLTTKEIAKKLGLTVTKTEKILYSHIDELDLEELVDYANFLHVPCQLRINIPYVKSTAEAY